MNKLEERFEDIYFEHVMGEERNDQFKSVTIYAKEAKDIAIEFADWMTKYKVENFPREINLTDVPDEITPMDFIMDKLFNEFIEEKYETK